MLDTPMLDSARHLRLVRHRDGGDDPQPEDRGDDRRPSGGLGRAGRPGRRSRPTTRFAAWSRTTPAERSALLLKLAEPIESGSRSLRDARGPELRQAAHPRAAGRDAGRSSTASASSPAPCARCTAPSRANIIAGHTSMIRRDPIGVVASIAPWNYPLMMAAWKLAPALAGGNTVVIKPSEQTPLTMLKLARLIADIFPEGVVNVVVGRGESVGSALINHPKVAMISLTGDVATGKKVLAGGLEDHQAHASGARRQGAGDRLRRCRHRRRRRRREAVRLLQCGAGLHGRLPDLCRHEDLRQPRRRPLLGRGRAQVQPGRRRRERHRPAHLRRASARACRPSSSAPPSKSTSRSRRAAELARAAASSTSRRWSPARSSPTRSCGARCSGRWSR